MRGSIAALGTVAVLAACTTTSSSSQDDRPPPPTAHWSTGTPLPIARFEAYAAVAQGRTYFIGGITGVLGDIRTAEPSRRVDVYDPGAMVWSAGPELPADAPKHHLSVTVWSDAIYVLGGFDGILGKNGAPFVPVALAYVLDPGATAWRKLAPPPLARGAATAQAIDGLIYVAGGAPNEGLAPFAQLDAYDIRADRWTTKTAMPTAREHVASCAILGTMIVVGGWKNAAKTTQRAAEQYDPKTDAWSTLPDLPTGRGGLAAVAIGPACHVIGGEDWSLPPPGTFPVHEVYDTITERWTTDLPMPTSRHGLGLAWLDGGLYAIGGGPSQGNSYTAIVEALRP